MKDLLLAGALSLALSGCAELGNDVTMATNVLAQPGTQAALTAAECLTASLTAKGTVKATARKLCNSTLGLAAK